MKRLLAPAIALALLATAAHAQTGPVGGPDAKTPPAPAAGMHHAMDQDGMGGPGPMGGPGGPDGMGPHGHPPMGGPGPMAMHGGPFVPPGPHVHLRKGDAELDVACKPDDTMVACADQAIRILQAAAQK